MKKNFSFIIAVLFSLGIKAQNATPASQSSNDESLVIVEQQASFNNDNAGLIRFLTNNLKYPAAEKNAAVSGTVFLKLFIDSTGTIKDITEMKGVPGHPAFTEEAIRVVKLMPGWIPAKKNGKALASTYYLPIKWAVN